MSTEPVDAPPLLSDLSAEELAAAQPTTVYVEGIGEVPVVYTFEQDLPVLAADVVLARRPGVAEAHVGNEMVLYHPPTDTICALDAVAALLWQCLDGVATLGDIAADIADVLVADPQAVELECCEAASEWHHGGFTVSIGLDVRPMGIVAPPPPPRPGFLADPPDD